ncbi:YIP1 family protein [Shewanella sp. 202IG2-18]|uniref:YIP1 family protein n=1 Tax=Parashewanella hymeniacidonis TaxID=2807618 RepID=UPI001960CDE0|nr:YIP1 family protein [Parashewanella hymeniacidonis]MBM7074130.1 YIP1 family protein [Parashewanella hymeniacidonis]
MKSATVFGAITDIFLSPTKAFNGLKEAKGWSWSAFLLIILFSSVAMYLFYTTVDPNYLVDQQIAALGDELTAQEHDAAVNGIKQFADIQIYFAICAPIVAIALFNALYAFYFMLISKIDPQSDMKFGAWYGFSIWTMMPAVINSLGTIILVTTAKTDQLSQSIFNYASLNQLVLNLDIHNAYYGLVESIGLFTVWGMILTIIGLKSWTNFTKNQAVIYGLLPSVVIFGIWFLIATLK